MTRKVWVEAALNGPWRQSRQPKIPITVPDIVAAGISSARAGAAIIHVPAYDPVTERQNGDANTYSSIIEGIRAQVDAIVYPTIPLAGSDLTGAPLSSTERYSHISTLASRGLIEMSVVDPGSVNFLHKDSADSASGFVYLNSAEDISYGIRLARDTGIRPCLATNSPGGSRQRHLPSKHILSF